MPQFDQLAPTHQYSPQAPASGSSPRDRVSLIEADEHDRTNDGLMSSRQRLQIVCSMLLVGFGVFYFRNVFVEGFFGKLWRLWAFAFGVLGLSEMLLVFWKPTTRRRLLVIELLIFGGTACYFSALMHYSVLRNVNLNPPLANWIVFSVMTSTTWCCVLAFTYAMVAAESRRRAVAMVTLLSGAPAVVAIYEWTQSPVFAEVVNGGMLTMIVLTSVFCCGVLVYWVYRLDRLKKEAARARRFGQYRLKRLIGRGGMGEVYLAEHTLLKRPCALKRIRPGHDTDPVTLARFEREVRATAELSHPHTVEIYDYGRAGDGTFYYVMELLWGLTFDDLIHKHGPLPAARAVYLLRQVCEALEEAHAAGLIHRDIKPSNIYAARRGGEYDFVKLLDFGLVKGVMRADQPSLSRRNGGRIAPLHVAGTDDQRADVGRPRRSLLARCGGILPRCRPSPVHRGKSAGDHDLPCPRRRATSVAARSRPAGRRRGHPAQMSGEGAAGKVCQFGGARRGLGGLLGGWAMDPRRRGPLVARASRLARPGLGDGDRHGILRTQNKFATRCFAARLTEQP